MCGDREEVSNQLNKPQRTSLLGRTLGKMMTLSLITFFFPNKGGNLHLLWFTYYVFCGLTYCLCCSQVKSTVTRFSSQSIPQWKLNTITECFFSSDLLDQLCTWLFLHQLNQNCQWYHQSRRFQPCQTYICPPQKNYFFTYINQKVIQNYHSSVSS